MCGNEGNVQQVLGCHYFILSYHPLNWMFAAVSFANKSSLRCAAKTSKIHRAVWLMCLTALQAYTNDALNLDKSWDQKRYFKYALTYFSQWKMAVALNLQGAILKQSTVDRRDVFLLILTRQERCFTTVTAASSGLWGLRDVTGSCDVTESSQAW